MKPEGNYIEIDGDINVDSDILFNPELDTGIIRVKGSIRAKSIRIKKGWELYVDKSITFTADVCRFDVPTELSGKNGVLVGSIESVKDGDFVEATTWTDILRK